MGTSQRINVASGRPLEKLAHYSRALRAGAMVLQAGTTATDRQGNVQGEGDIAQQVDAIIRLAEWSMGKAGGKLEDVVRSRIYVTDIAPGDRAARTLAQYFRDVRPVATLVQVNRLARPEQLIEIEFDAIDGAKGQAQRISSGRAIETVDSAQVNRQYGEGPAWFANSCPASLGCRVIGLARPELLVEVEVAAFKGAHANIEWIGPDTVDPLDRGGI